MMRLLPRFSLHTALIALTIFLIVFAVVTRYAQEYLEHERIVLQLQAINGSVEEESITCWGATIGKRLTGIELQPPEGASLELLAKLPRPLDVRRLGCNGIHYDNEAATNQLCRAIAGFPELEQLHLSDLSLTEEQLALLQSLPKLHILNFTSVHLPSGSLQLLKKMPNLETLILDETSCEVMELLQFDLPRLRSLYLNECSLTYLEFTKSDWGRFPLETLVIRDHKLSGVDAEAGALPRLKHLDLGCEGGACQIDWKSFPAAMPELTLFAVPTPWLEAEMIPQLAEFTRLRYLYVEVDQTLATPPSQPNTEPGTFETTLTLKISGGQRVVLPPAYGPSGVQNFAPLDLTANTLAVPRRLQPAIKTLQAKRPDLLFSADYTAVSELLDSLGLAHYVTPMWPSLNWRPNPNTAGGFF